MKAPPDEDVMESASPMSERVSEEARRAAARPDEEISLSASQTEVNEEARRGENDSGSTPNIGSTVPAGRGLSKKTRKKLPTNDDVDATTGNGDTAGMGGKEGPSKGLRLSAHGNRAASVRAGVRRKTSQTRGLSRSAEELHAKRAARASSTVASLHASPPPIKRGLRAGRKSGSAPPRGSRQMPTEATQATRNAGATDLPLQMVEGHLDNTSETLEPRAAATNEAETPTPARFSNDGLVEAIQVEDSLAQAVEVDPAELEQRALKEKKEKECRLIGMCLILVSLAVVLVAIFARPKKESNGQGVAQEPTEIPSIPPTTAGPSSPPIGVLESFQAGLPNFTKESLKNISTPQWEAYVWLENHPNVTQIPEWRKMQLFALATFFYAFGGPHWPEDIRETWLEYDDECFWFSTQYGSFLGEEGKYLEFPLDAGYGLPPCNDENEFQLLMLGDLGLVEHNSLFVPPEITFLTTLSVLALPKNNISASISDFLPSQIFQMTNLIVLNLRSNDLDGKLPVELGALKSVMDLQLADNRFTGSLPSELGLMTSITNLAVHENNWTGTIPTQLGGLPKMDQITMYSNHLSGQIPSELGLLTDMTLLYLYGNNLTARIPTQMGEIVSLEELQLGDNDLTVQIPSELGLLSNMTRLYLHANNLTATIPTQLGKIVNLVYLGLGDNGLTGQVPSELGLLTGLTDLLLYRNGLAGTLPADLMALTQLKALSLNSNSLDGAIPTEIGLLRAMTSLLLSVNDFSGAIPSELGLLTGFFFQPGISELYISSCSLTGSIPTEIGRLTNLHTVRLNGNALTGFLTTELGSLNNLQTLRLNDNALTGSLTTELGKMFRLLELQLAKNNLVGSLPDELGRLSRLTSLNLYLNEFTGPIPSDFGKMIAMTELYLLRNGLTGTIPSQLGMMTSLTDLSFHGNNLTGTIPSELSLLTGMERLSFGKQVRGLSGPIPSQLGSMSHMTVMLLFANSLSGTIPTELGLMSSLDMAAFNNNSLIGPIPEELGRLEGSLVALTLDSNSLSGVAPAGLCSLGKFNLSAYIGLAPNVGFSFDCNEQLCGCEWCPCQALKGLIGESNDTLAGANNVFALGEQHP